MGLRTFFFLLGSLVLSVYILIIGKTLILPLVLAVFIWYLINVLTDVYARIKIRGRSLPRMLCFTASLLTILAALWCLQDIITSNVAKVAELAPFYQERMIKLTRRALDMLQLKQTPNIAQLIGYLNLRKIISLLAGTLTGLAGNAGLILVYLIFILLEQKSFNTKLSVVVSNPKQEETVRKIINRIDSDIRIYIGIKTLISFLTAIASFFVMIAVGIDFATFWGIIIFIFNFIPVIGPVIATICPALLALVQFDSFYPFIIVTSSISAIQVVIGNFLETKLMGNSLNMSPILILISLAVWQQIWGIAGMFLGMPIMVIVMIILSHFPRTRPVALMFSKDGKI